MNAEIVIIGTELLLGHMVDTNAVFIARALAEHGIHVHRKTTVGDNRQRIVKVLAEALERADAVLTSGGLGPTEDDVTREAVADLLDRPLEFREDLYKKLSARFASMGRPMTENNKKQAYLPHGATAIENPNGTAPGFVVDDDRGVVVSMPGVPHELQGMLIEHVIPYLREAFGVRGVLRSRVLKVCGVGESRIDAAIGHLIRTQENPTIGLQASPDAVRIRITARADTADEAEALIDALDAQVQAHLPGLVMGINEDTLERVVDELLTKRGWALALAETNTGGMIAQRLTAAGAKALAGGVTLPPTRFEDRDPKTAALELAHDIAAQCTADCALALVYHAPEHQTVAVFLTPEGTYDWTVRYPGTGERHQLRVSIVSLEHVRRILAG